MKNALTNKKKGNSILMGILYVSNLKKEVDLRKMATKIENEFPFFVEFVADEYFLKLKSKDEVYTISIYFDGLVYFQKEIDYNSLISLEMFNAAREGYDIIRKLLPVRYLQRIDLNLKGNDISYMYEKNKWNINEFGLRLFNNPIFSELKVKKDCIDVSIISKEFLCV
jgi:hypothetical protein